MKQSIKKAILKCLLSQRQYQKIYSEDILFPGGVLPINDTNDDDVFVVGFPKSGNTLMQHIITHLIYGINEKGSRSIVNLIVPDIYSNSHYFRFDDRCFFKSHNLPQSNYKKVIYIMRDGRQALLSYYHMMNNMGTPVSLEDLYSGKIKLFNATWSSHIEQWEKNPYEADILWLKFEDLKVDKMKELKRICAFLNIERSADQLENVVKLSSLAHMKELEKRSDWVRINKNKFIKGKKFLRQGSLDSFKQEVGNSQIEKFEKMATEMLTKHYPNE